MKFVSFFAGIGGFDLGMENAGHTCVGQVEIDPFCQSVLVRHWPDIWRHDDIRTIDPTTIPAADLWVGGFPCQDLSAVGRQAGLAGAKSGLWYTWLDLIRECRPSAVVAENIFSRWRAWVPTVRGDLHQCGYASVCIRVRAGDLGFRHQRARGFVVAYLVGERRADVEAFPGAWDGPAGVPAGSGAGSDGRVV